ncbi:MAG: hypothetical protein EXS14_09235 [Planctomycetes bacterium]|nr:hypothetical protein [Planctomycetota bacterium]
MTSEATGPTEKWIAEKGAKYGYAYDKGGKFMRACGVSGIPHAMLVDASGKVVFDGGPNQITDEMVKAACTGALTTPLWELPKPFAKVRTAISKGDYAAALKESQALLQDAANGETATKVADAVKGMVAGSLASADGMSVEGDFLGAERELQRLLKSAKGLPEEAAARAKLAAFASNDAAKKGMKAQKALEALTAEPLKSKKDAEKRVTELEAFIKKNEGTFAGKKALEQAEQLKGSLKQGD